MTLSPLVLSVRESGRASGCVQNSCPFCEVRLAEGQEPFVCADGTKDVSCGPCHLVRHLDRHTIAEEAVLIWLPEMTQPALNRLANAAHRRLAEADVLYRAANPLAGLHQDTASGAIEGLRAIEKRRIEAEARLGTSSPRLLAAALLRAKPRFYQDRARLLGGLRLLCRARFFVDGEDIYPRLIAGPGAPVTIAVVQATAPTAHLPRDEAS